MSDTETDRKSKRVTEDEDMEESVSKKRAIEKTQETSDETAEDESKVEPAEDKPKEVGEFKDEDLDCRDCGKKFVFSAGEQEFFAEKGFENKPVRCSECKQAKKDRMNGSRGGGDRSRGGRSNACYAFQRGECDRGTSCRFSHDDNDRGGSFRDDRRGGSFRDDRRGASFRDDRRGASFRDDRGGGSSRDDRGANGRRY
jgi:cleavage and polyadenylation specificity factor subunit 4